ncbi:MAG: porin [Bernardetiaceae bacterium]
MKPIIFLLFIWTTLATSHALAQEEERDKSLTISGYIETYYIYDFANPSGHTRPDFLFSFNRHNEINLNFGFIQAEYTRQRLRGKLAFMAGTYANANLAAEALKNIFEANAGIKISPTKNLWLDAGIFASHLGFGSAIGADCWNMTRSLAAESSPYYSSGVKLSYASDNEQWFLSGQFLNGWQRIQRVPGNQTPAFGHQITWTPHEKIMLNSSSFIGSDTPDSLRQMRYFHNFYGQFQFSDKIGLLVGFDIGAEQKAKGSTDYHTWYVPTFIARFAPTQKIALAGRLEYYSDKGGVIVANGFEVLGYSLNLDIRWAQNFLWRIEARGFGSQNGAIFLNRDDQPTTSNYAIGTSLSISF